MSILQLPLPIAANTGVTPNIKTMRVTDDLATVTTAGYLNYGNLQGYTVSANDEIHCWYNADVNTPNSGEFVILKPTISNGVITLVADISEGNVVLPTTVNHIAVYVNDKGKIGEDTFIAINDGDIQAGVPGSSSGGFISMPGLAGTGSLKLQAFNNAADYDITLSNVSFSDSSVLYLSDPLAPSGYIQVSQQLSDPCSNLFYVEANYNSILLGFGPVTVYTASPGAQYRIREIFLPYNGTGAFSGGDRDLILTDGTSTFLTLTAATLQAPVNARWGSAQVPYPPEAIGGIFANTVVGANLSLQYSGGTTNYTNGNMGLIILLERVT